MTSLKNLWVRLVKDEEGASLIEYVLLAALIGVAAIAAMTKVATEASGTLDRASAAMKTAGTTPP